LSKIENQAIEIPRFGFHLDLQNGTNKDIFNQKHDDFLLEVTSRSPSKFRKIGALIETMILL